MQLRLSKSAQDTENKSLEHSRDLFEILRIVEYVQVDEVTAMHLPFSMMNFEFNFLLTWQTAAL
jgi:hypothetical protein